MPKLTITNKIFLTKFFIIAGLVALAAGVPDRLTLAMSSFFVSIIAELSRKTGGPKPLPDEIICAIVQKRLQTAPPDPAAGDRDFWALVGLPRLAKVFSGIGGLDAEYFKAGDSFSYLREIRRRSAAMQNEPILIIALL